MDRGVNTTILNAKNTLAETINNILKEGIPPVVVSMIVEGLYNELDNLVKKTVEKEQEQFQNKKELEDNQVLYKENNSEEVN